MVELYAAVAVACTMVALPLLVMGLLMKAVADALGVTA